MLRPVGAEEPANPHSLHKASCFVTVQLGVELSELRIDLQGRAVLVYCCLPGSLFECRVATLLGLAQLLDRLEEVHCASVVGVEPQDFLQVLASGLEFILICHVCSENCVGKVAKVKLPQNRKRVQREKICTCRGAA